MQEDEHRISKVLASGALLVGSGTLFIVQQNCATAASGGRDISAVWPIGAALLVLGVLGWLRIRLATYLLAGAAALAGLRVIVSAFTTPFPFWLATLIFGLILVAPAALLVGARRKGRDRDISRARNQD